LNQKSKAEEGLGVNDIAHQFGFSTFAVSRIKSDRAAEYAKASRWNI